MAINLLPSNLQQEQEKSGQKVVTNAVSVSALIILIAGLGVLFSYRVFLTRQLSEVTTQLNELSRDVEKQRIIEGALQSIHLKLSRVQPSLEGRFSYGQIVDDLSQLSFDQIQLDAIEVGQDNRFVVSGNTGSLVQLADYLRGLKDISPNYQQVRVTRMSFDGTEFIYHFVIEFVYQFEA